MSSEPDTPNYLDSSTTVDIEDTTDSIAKVAFAGDSEPPAVDDPNTGTKYKSGIKLFYAASERGAWALGKSFILKERSTSPPIHEAASLKFLRGNTNLPVPYIAQEWTDDDRYFNITSRVEGETLQEACPKLSSEDKDRIATQAAGHLKGLFDKEDGQAPLSSDEEFWSEIMRPLPELDEHLLRELKDNMPPCAPYTFSHGDLTFCNIMAKDGHFAGFIDFERADFFPVWWEFVGLRYVYSGGDREWKNLLCSKMEQFRTAGNFFITRERLWADPSGESSKELRRDLVEKVDRCPVVNYW
ncbi:kinase-like domain-containing protein [Xylariaceae sp. FL0255]|nr:kinase-like domain-containing protein [Xylariaceae sp. FL0255]